MALASSAQDAPATTRGQSGAVPGSSPCTAPALGIDVTANFEFDVPVRFDTDHMAVTIETYLLHAWQQIPIIELRT